MSYKILAIFVIVCAIHYAESTDIVEMTKSGFKSATSAIKSAAKTVYCGIRSVVKRPCEEKLVHAVVEEIPNEGNLSLIFVCFLLLACLRKHFELTLKSRSPRHIILQLF